MCTVSWLRRPDGYVLLSNRDESHSRKPALGPRPGEQRGVSYVAPVDGDHGGSWIGVNHFGLTLCLLNRYSDRSQDPNRSYLSRGVLLIDLLDAETCNQVQARVLASDLERFPAFTLAVLNPDEAAFLIHWTEGEFLVEPDAEKQVPLTSSSLKQPEIVSGRKALFNQMLLQSGRLDMDLLDRFHRSHLPKRGPSSVCMHREDAATVSMSLVTVGPELIEFGYHPASPCVTAATEKVWMARRPGDKLGIPTRRSKIKSAARSE
jgi:hypothetical protein